MEMHMEMKSKYLPATVKTDITFRAIGRELQIDRSVMRRQGYNGRDPLSGADGIIHRLIRHKSIVHVADQELVAHDQAVAPVRNGFDVPRGVAVRVPMIQPLIQIVVAADDAVVVQLVAGVVLRDILAVARRVVHAHFDAVDPARQRVLGDADRVAQAPSQELACGVEVLGRR